MNKVQNYKNRKAAATAHATSKVKEYMTKGTHVSQASKDTAALVDELRLQLTKNEKTIINLNSERLKLQSQSTGHLTTDDLLRKIRDRESEIRDLTTQFQDVEASLIKKERMFKESKSYMDEIIKQIGEQKINN